MDRYDLGDGVSGTSLPGAALRCDPGVRIPIPIDESPLSLGGPPPAPPTPPPPMVPNNDDDDDPPLLPLCLVPPLPLGTSVRAGVWNPSFVQTVDVVDVDEARVLSDEADEDRRRSDRFSETVSEESGRDPAAAKLTEDPGGDVPNLAQFEATSPLLLLLLSL